MRPIGPEANRTTGPGRASDRGAASLQAPGLDVHALWREVFEATDSGRAEHERAPAGSPARAPTSASITDRASGRAAARGAAGATTARAEALGRPPDASSGSGPASLSAGSASPSHASAGTPARPVRWEDAEALSGPGAASTSVVVCRLEPAPPASIGPGPSANAPALLFDREPEPRPQDAAGAAPRESRAGPTPPAADGALRSHAEAARPSVQVRCHDGSVAVVVRDASMAPALAVRWSLETAYALRGERAALQRVTLNGRTVFERTGPPPQDAGLTPSGPLCFAC